METIELPRTVDIMVDTWNDLARMSGYTVAFLVDTWHNLVTEAKANGEAPDWNYFVGVTLDRDW